MEGNIKQGLSMRESPVSAPLEGKVFPVLYLDTFNFVQQICLVGLGCIQSLLRNLYSYYYYKCVFILLYK